MRVVCISAHQDDEMGCLGTLVKYRKRGDGNCLCLRHEWEQGDVFQTGHPTFAGSGDQTSRDAPGRRGTGPRATAAWS